MSREVVTIRSTLAGATIPSFCGLGAGVTTIYGYGANDRIDVMDLTGVTLTQSGSNTLIGVGSDQLAILDQTSVSAVTFV
jgi:hypothetical protein